MDRRKETITRGLDLRNSRGVEMGPLHAPIVKKSDGHIIYVDHADTDTILEKYKNNPEVDPAKIVKIDAVWGKHDLKETVGTTVDYIIASHVVEHVPNLIGWLNELADALTDTGQIRLAVPDKRYTLDLYRRLTSLADVMAAYVQNTKRPLPAQIIDHHLYARDLNFREIWNGTVAAFEAPGPLQLKNALQLAEESFAQGIYNDVHCWVFTPASFANLMQDLSRLGLVKLKCTGFTATAYEDLEFFVALGKTDDREEAVRSWVLAEEEGAKQPVEPPKPAQKSLASRLWRRIRPKRRRERH